jgi:hypothetical protein
MSHFKESEQGLLNLLLQEVQVRGGGVPAAKFRADHWDDIEALEKLEEGKWLRRENEQYLVQSTVLPLLDSTVARELLSSTERIYAVMRAEYREQQQAPVLVSTIAAKTGLSHDVAAATMTLMLDASLWCSGRSAVLHQTESQVNLSESVLKYKTFSDLLAEVRSWNKPSPLTSAFSYEPSTGSTQHEPTLDAAPDLPAGLARAVLAVTDEIEGVEYTLNSYFDDPEPRSVIDSILTGKLNSLRVYCTRIGLRMLAKELGDLLPLNGNAVEAMELVESFIIPEVRRLVVVKPEATAAAQVREPVSGDDLLKAWPAVRACLQRLHFYDVKEVAGLAGFDVTAVAHLVQKTQAGASKGELMSAVDQQVADMSLPERRRFLTTLIEEVLRRRPQDEEQLAEYLSRLGWSFVNDTLVPLELFDTGTLVDTPEEAHHDLLKAAQRLRDGDLGGAISAACGAVDTATSRVYEEQGSATQPMRPSKSGAKRPPRQKAFCLTWNGNLPCWAGSRLTSCRSRRTSKAL